jgi:1,4-dihydroxy-2-naphthoyl-CoA synthase
MTAAAVQVGRVRQERHGHILKIVLDNPAKMNAFSPEMMEELSAAFTDEHPPLHRCREAVASLWPAMTS